MKTPAKMLVRELREALESRGLETTGLKSELVVRLNEAFESNPAEPVAEPATDEVAEASETADASASEPAAVVVETPEAKTEETPTDEAESAPEKAESTAASSPSTAKRLRETSTDEPSAVKRAAVSVSNIPSRAASGLQVQLKCLVANQHAGSIIGKGGSIIGQIQKDSGSRVQLSRNGVFFPGTQDRVLMLTADTLNEVLIGFSLVLAKQYECCAKDSGNVGKDVSGDAAAMAVRLVVPNGSAGVIIGKGGSNIKEITSKSGARVQLAQKEEMVQGLEERVVTVTGAMEQQLQCTHLMLSKMHEDEATATRSQYTNTGVAYNAQPMPMRQPMAYQNRMPNGMMMMMHRGQPAPRQPVPMGGRMQPRMGYAPRSPQPRAMMSMAPRGASPPAMPQAGLTGAVTKMTVQVPDGMVGCIIGTAGKAINDIQRFSGARVQISKRGEYFEGTQNRIVTMQGTMQQCQHAQVLIQQTMDSAPPRQQ